jgi:hypothetical protein
MTEEQRRGSRLDRQQLAANVGRDDHARGLVETDPGLPLGRRDVLEPLISTERIQGYEPPEELVPPTIYWNDSCIACAID